MFVCPVRHASNTQRPHHVTHVSNLGKIDLLACGSFLEPFWLNYMHCIETATTELKRCGQSQGISVPVSVHTFSLNVIPF